MLLKKARFDYRFFLGSNFISIDSTSTAQLNAIQFQPYLSYDTALDTVYKLDVRIQKMKAQALLVRFRWIVFPF
jgi:hypothetical protein